MNSAYFSPTLPVNLFSLGQMQRCGATYGPDPLRPLSHVTIRSSPSGPLLAHAALSTHNLLPVDFAALLHASSINPLSYYHPVAMAAHSLVPHTTAEQPTPYPSCMLYPISTLSSALALMLLKTSTLNFVTPLIAASVSTSRLASSLSAP